MPRSYRYLHLDVFTGRPFSGNQLAVFLDGRGLKTAEMQAIAREMNFSESTFILPPEDRATDMRVRIFTPAAELPMAGHPTVGSAFALARAGVLAPPMPRVVFGLGVGPTVVDLTWSGDDLASAFMTQPLPVFGDPLDDVAPAAAALRLPAEAVARTGLPVQTISCGVQYLMVPLATRAQVDAAVLDPAGYERLSEVLGITTLPVYLFTTEPGPGEPAATYSRMFAPALGVPEDPGTGSAAGPLGCYLVAHSVIAAEKADTIVNRQGVHMGRPSVIRIDIASQAGTITRVRVGGEAVLAGEGTLYV